VAAEDGVWPAAPEMADKISSGRPATRSHAGTHSLTDRMSWAASQGVPLAGRIRRLSGEPQTATGREPLGSPLAGGGIAPLAVRVFGGEHAMRINVAPHCLEPDDCRRVEEERWVGAVKREAR
jgi:hypothetical protein